MNPLPWTQCVLETTLFNGDVSLHTIYLMRICTELPWRNMVNLTSFTLGYNLPGEVTIRQLLDFLALPQVLS